MSFLAVFNSDRAAIDLEWLRRMPAAMASRHVQILGMQRQVALIGPQLGWALPREGRPRCDAFDGRFWLIGRVRLDRRKELCSILTGSEAPLEQPCDARILLGAYARWGDRCLEHLQGDFCFVLWDEERQRLFCGRDQLGVRPLFYATQRNSWTISDSLELLVAESKVGGDLDDYWVADFLCSGVCGDSDRTVYKEIKRLPAAHCLSVSAHGCVIQKYWTLEVHDPIYYPHTRNYVEHFDEVVGCAVKDRLPQGRVGISMSGGLDSSTLAAYALRATGDASKVIAHTRHFERLMQDSEKDFSLRVASRLGIPLMLRAVDDACYDPHWYQRELRTSEPKLAMVRAAPERVIAAEMAEQTQVWFYGEGPDNALAFEWQPYLRWLFKSMAWCRFGGAVAEYLLNKRAREWRSTVINFVKRQAAGESKARPFGLPQWLNEGFVRERHLIERACQLSQSPNNKHPWHPRAIASFASSRWQHFFEGFDTPVSGIPLVWRHPYLDLRVLHFLLSVPPIPWARRKRLVREAMRGWLPQEILSRDKTTLRAIPLAIMLRKHGLPPLSQDGSILRYIDHGKLPKVLPEEVRPLLRVYVLDAWLKFHARRFHTGLGSDGRPF